MDNAADGMQAEFDEARAKTLQILARLLSISKSTRALLYLKLAEIDFHNGQDELVLALDKGEEIGVSTVAFRLNVRPSTASKMIDRLVEKRLLARTGDNSDSRRTIVCLTPAGVTAKEEVGKLRGRLEAELFGRLPGEDLHGVARSMDLLAGKLKARLARMR